VQGPLRSCKSALWAYCVKEGKMNFWAKTGSWAYCVKEGKMNFWVKTGSISQWTKPSYAINIL